MKEATKRSIFRWIHIVFAIPIIGYIYSPFDQIPNYAPATRSSAKRDQSAAFVSRRHSAMIRQSVERTTPQVR
jgi:hypothetical protein